MEILPFFTFQSPFSNHYSCYFAVKGKTYTSSEQYYMSVKASFFNDPIAYKIIMGTNDCAKQKLAGRHVKGYNEFLWKKVRDNVMRDALASKFEQSRKLTRILRATGTKTLIECNEHDTYWSSGISVDAMNRGEPWTGRNKLGTLLMELRDNMEYR